MKIHRSGARHLPVTRAILPITKIICADCKEEVDVSKKKCENCGSTMIIVRGIMDEAGVGR